MENQFPEDGDLIHASRKEKMPIHTSRKKYKGPSFHFHYVRNKIVFTLQVDFAMPEATVMNLFAFCEYLLWVKANKENYYLMQVFLPFHWPTAHHVTCKIIIFCSCVIETTFSREKWLIASLSRQVVIKI